jgi:hypothetical protein
MYSFDPYADPFGFIFMILPLVSIVIGFFCYAVFRNNWIGAVWVAASLLVAAILFFNGGFVIWIAVNTLITLLAGRTAKALLNKRGS